MCFVRFGRKPFFVYLEPSLVTGQWRHSQRLVLPGAATDGVTLLFYLKKDDIFSRHQLEPDDLFSHRLVTTRPSNVVCRVFFVN